MKALVFYGKREIRLEEVARPEPGLDEVLLRVTKAGLCQTQVNEFVEGPYTMNVEPNPQTGKAIPLVAGHQFGGVVESVGSDVDPSITGARGCGATAWRASRPAARQRSAAPGRRHRRLEHLAHAQAPARDDS